MTLISLSTKPTLGLSRHSHLLCKPADLQSTWELKVGRANWLPTVVFWLPHMWRDTQVPTCTHTTIKYKHKKEYTLMSAIKMTLAFYLNIYRDEIPKSSLRRKWGFELTSKHEMLWEYCSFIWFSATVLCCRWHFLSHRLRVRAQMVTPSSQKQCES